MSCTRYSFFKNRKWVEMLKARFNSINCKLSNQISWGGGDMWEGSLGCEYLRGTMCAE